MGRSAHSGGRWTVLAIFATLGLVASPQTAQGALTVTVGNIKPGGVIPPEYAYCVPAQQRHAKPGPDKSPAISWSKGPARTASYAIVVVDPDVPAVLDDANKEGKTISAGLQRMNFYHWVLIDIPTSVTSLPEGADTADSSPKKPGPTKYGVRGISDYSEKGEVFGGYDGPCPPWNDEIPHHYHFVVYALDVAQLAVRGNFTGPDALKAMRGHVLAKGELVGVYSLNPAVAKTLGK